MKSFKIFLCLIVLFFTSGFHGEENTPRIDQNSLLEQHNYYRKMVGVPDLKWGNELAAYAQNWANQLAKSCDMVHSQGNYGENIYWTSGSSTEKQVVDYWGAEKQYFNHKKPIFKSSFSSRYGHYTQIIWKETTHVGGAKAYCKHGGEMWVCSYSPHGNVVGKKAF